MVENEVIGDMSSKKEMSFHASEVLKFRTKIN